MKKFILLLVGVTLIASCSTPKYTYHFDHYDYNAKKKTVPSQATVNSSEQPLQQSVLSIQEETLTASAKENEFYEAKENPPAVTKEEAVAKIKSMTKEERKELKREIKRVVKESKNEGAKEVGAKKLQNDVKLAAIFGAVGIVLLIIGGDVLYIIGAVALIVGLFFLVRWLMRQ